MKKLIRYFIFVISISVTCLSAINFIIERSLRNQKEDVYGKLNEIFGGKENYDVLFVGSSRTLVHVNPVIIDTILKANSFNAGFDGLSIVECKMFIESYLEKHFPPAVLVLNIDMGSLQITDSYKQFDYPLYLPYLKDKFVKETLNEYTPSTKVLNFFPFLKPAYYNDFKKYLALKTFAGKEGDKKNILYKGYAPKEIPWSGQNIQSRFSPAYNARGISLLKNILSICTQHKIIPVIVYAPQTAELTNNMDNFSAFKNQLRAISSGNQGIFLDYSGIPLTKDKKYFYNHLHMVSKGADIYSALLANDLRRIINNNRKI